MGLVVPKTRDGRVLFFLPWEGMTICGTTDAPSDITMTPSPTQDDVTFIIEESNRYLNRTVRHPLSLACLLARVVASSTARLQHDRRPRAATPACRSSRRM